MPHRRLHDTPPAGTAPTAPRRHSTPAGVYEDEAPRPGMREWKFVDDTGAAFVRIEALQLALPADDRVTATVLRWLFRRSIRRMREAQRAHQGTPLRLLQALCAASIEVLALSPLA